MNPDTTAQTVEPTATAPITKSPHPVHQITLLSKYLTMAIFIILPFVGAYIGYRLAPEPVVEVESPVAEQSLDVPVSSSDIPTQEVLPGVSMSTSTSTDMTSLKIVSCAQGTVDIPGLPLNAIKTALENYSPEKSDFINEELQRITAESGSNEKVGFHCTLNDGSTILTIFGASVGDVSIARISKNVMTTSVSVPTDAMGSMPGMVPKNSTTTVTFTGHIIDPCYDLAQNFIFNLTDFSFKLISKTGGDIPNCKANI